MNWTGGRLQRHSRNTPRSLTAKQRKHFAKSRVQQNPKLFSSLPVDSFSAFANEKATSSPVQADGKDDFQSHGAIYRLPDLPVHSPSPLLQREFEYRTSYERASGKTSNEMVGPSVTEIQSNKGTSHANEKDNSSFMPTATQINSVKNSFWECKQKLLQQKDWISANRSTPVRMKFPRKDQASQFGKRRKISPAEKSQSKPASKTSVKAQGYATSPGNIVICIDDQVVHGKHPKRQDDVLSHMQCDLPNHNQALYKNSVSVSPSLSPGKEVLTFGHTPGFTDEYLDECGVRKLYFPEASPSFLQSSSPILETPNCSPLAVRERNQLSSSKSHGQRRRQPHSRQEENQTSANFLSDESVIGSKLASLLNNTGESNGSVTSDTLFEIFPNTPFENETSLTSNQILENSNVDMLKSFDRDGASTCVYRKADPVSRNDSEHGLGYDLSVSPLNNKDDDLVADFSDCIKEKESTESLDGPGRNVIRFTNNTPTNFRNSQTDGIQDCAVTKFSLKNCSTSCGEPCEKQIGKSEDDVWMEFVLADPVVFP